jgi:uncharacterized protein (TIGR02246 family)
MIRQTEDIEHEAIIAETQAFAEAWGRGDARAAASFYADDGVRVGAFGDVQQGRDEIERAYSRLFNQVMPGAKISQERGTVRMLAPDLAVWQAGIEITPVGEASPMRGHVVQVMQKVGDRWLVVEAHPKIFPPPLP